MQLNQESLHEYEAKMIQKREREEKKRKNVEKADEPKKPEQPSTEKSLDENNNVKHNGNENATDYAENSNNNSEETSNLKNNDHPDDETNKNNESKLENVDKNVKDDPPAQIQPSGKQNHVPPPPLDSDSRDGYRKRRARSLEKISSNTNKKIDETSLKRPRLQSEAGEIIEDNNGRFLDERRRSHDDSIDHHDDSRDLHDDSRDRNHNSRDRHEDSRERHDDFRDRRDDSRNRRDDFRDRHDDSTDHEHRQSHDCRGDRRDYDTDQYNRVDSRAAPISDPHICYDYVRTGNCTKPECRFGHYRSKSKVRGACHVLLFTGKCNNKNCNYKHDFQMCPEFNDNGRCPVRDCPFEHMMTDSHRDRSFGKERKEEPFRRRDYSSKSNAPSRSRSDDYTTHGRRHSMESRDDNGRLKGTCFQEKDNGFCDRNSRRFEHVNPTSRVCLNYLDNGRCDVPMCPRLHSRDSIPKHEQICHDFVVGKCDRRDICHRVHPRDRADPEGRCFQFFFTGKCAQRNCKRLHTREKKS
uniref:C3H1-type domain-containing protein n=2 Tax=Aplanochytrium stocchinoi TaxID=215587 RepID=A0A6S8ER74_9STRA